MQRTPIQELCTTPAACQRPHPEKFKDSLYASNCANASKGQRNALSRMLGVRHGPPRSIRIAALSCGPRANSCDGKLSSPPPGTGHASLVWPHMLSGKDMTETLGF